MNEDARNAATMLNVNSLSDAVKFGRIRVRVTDNGNPAQLLPDAQVTAEIETEVIVGAREPNGELTFEIDFSKMGEMGEMLKTKTVIITASQDGTESSVPVTAIALATIDVNLVLPVQP
jgi:hypothetical protein